MRGGVNRLFIVVAGLGNKSVDRVRKGGLDRSDVRPGLVIVTTILATIIKVLFAKSILGALAVDVVVKLVIAGVSIVAGMTVAFVFEVARIRQGMDSGGLDAAFSSEVVAQW